MQTLWMGVRPRPRPPRGGDGLAGLGDFADVRQWRLGSRGHDRPGGALPADE